MENEFISGETEQKMIADLKKIIDGKKQGAIQLGDYIDHKMEACFDFATLYESAYDLRFFIDSERQKGAKIEVGEDSIRVH